MRFIATCCHRNRWGSQAHPNLRTRALRSYAPRVNAYRFPYMPSSPRSHAPRGNAYRFPCMGVHSFLRSVTGASLYHSSRLTVFSVHCFHRPEGGLPTVRFDPRIRPRSHAPRGNAYRFPCMGVHSFLRSVTGASLYHSSRLTVFSVHCFHRPEGGPPTGSFDPRIRPRSHAPRGNAYPFAFIGVHSFLRSVTAASLYHSSRLNLFHAAGLQQHALVPGCPPTPHDV